MLPQASADFYRAQQRRTVATVAAARRVWAEMPLGDFDGGWVRVGPRLTALVSLSQVGSAREAGAYVPRVLAEQGQSVRPDLRLAPGTFAGIAPDGRPLDSLLYGSVIHAREVDVDSTQARLTAGRSWLDMTVQTVVQDAARDATMAAMVSRPRVRWMRLVNPPSCQRCAVLAGRVYSHRTSFQRHPRCDCQMVPTTDVTPDTLGQTISPGDVQDLTGRQRQMIDDGRDFNRVINDYQRKRGDYLPPTRVDRLTARPRADAVSALEQAGYLAA
jgi:hypothetical protein